MHWGGTTVFFFFLIILRGGLISRFFRLQGEMGSAAPVDGSLTTDRADLVDWSD